MAGFIQLSGEWFYRTDDDTYGLTRNDPVGAWSVVEDPVFPKAGSWTQNRDFDAGQSFSGYRQVTFLDDFYNRVHFLPASLDFGAISEPVFRQTFVWNAYLVSYQLDSVAPPSGASVSHTPPPSMPFVFKPLHVEPVGFTAAEEGVSSFYGDTVFTFATTAVYRLVTFGERSLLTELGPNWAFGVTETLIFKTEIVAVSRNGKEQRRALRAEPRRVIDYTQNLWGANRRKAEAQLIKWRRRTTLVSIDPYRAVLAADAASGALVISVAGGVPSWAQEGVVVKFAGRNVEAGHTATIQSTTSGTITFSSPVGVDLKTGDRAIWTVTGRLQDRTKFSHLTDDVGTMNMTYDMVPGVDPKYDPGTAPLTLNGYELFLKKPNWASPVSTEYMHYLQIVDFDRGRQEFFEHVDFATFVNTVGFSGIRETDILEVSDFFRRQMGQLREFYYPTWEKDIIPKNALTISTQDIRVEGTDLALFYAAQTTHKAVLIQLRDGTMLPFQIDNIHTVDDIDGNDSIIHLTTLFPYTISLLQIQKISWLMRCRLASDTLEIKWLTDNKATTQLAFKTLEQLE